MSQNKFLVRAEQNGEIQILPDNDRYKYRFEIKSESSNRLYIVAQNKKTNQWCCSCMGWIRHRNCKHLKTLQPLLSDVDAHQKRIG